MRHLHKTAFILCLLLPLSLAAQAQDAGPACGPMQLFQNQVSIEFIGGDPEQPQPGDRRILHWFLTDQSGDEVGTFHVVTTILGDAGTMGDLVTADGTLVFPNGEMFVAVTTSLEDAGDTGRSGRAPQVFRWAVLGGTDEFANAQGVLTTTVPTDEEGHLDQRPLDFDISC